MKKTITIFTLLFLLFSGSLLAQNPFPKKRSPYSISIHAGTQGAGLEGKYEASDRFNVRLGASFLPLGGNFVYDFKSTPSNVKLNSELLNAHAVGDWFPFAYAKHPAAQKLIVSAGLGYFFKSSGTANFRYNGTYNYGDIEISSEDIGELNTEVKWQKLAPYLGLGYDNLTINENFNFSFGLGTYYMSSPKTTITGTKLLTGNSSNEPQLNRNLSQYRWLPVLQINLNYNL